MNDRNEAKCPAARVAKTADVRLRERQVLFVAPDNEGTRRWGVYGCPDMYRDEDGSIVAYDGGHMSGHGMKRNCLPFGVRIAIEPARKSAPWLVEDKPWEKALNHLTIIHEEGKFRCWYSVIFPKPLGGENVEQTFQQGRQISERERRPCQCRTLFGAAANRRSIT